MTTAIRVTANGGLDEWDISENTLSKMQQAVGGLVQAIDLSPTLTMWCNEEGKLQNLARNFTAQVLWDARFGGGTDYIVGDVVFTGGTDDEGATLGLDEQTAGIIVNAHKACEFIRYWMFDMQPQEEFIGS
jgi:hypothetical protein